MRIIIKELKRLFSIKLTALLLLFTAIYTLLFCNALNFPNNFGNSRYDVPFYRELKEKFGNTIDEDELPSLRQMRQALIRDITPHILSDTIFLQNGIESYEQFDELFRANYEELSENKRAAQDEAYRFWFDNEETSRILFNIQNIDYILYSAEEDYLFGDSVAVEAFLKEFHSGASEIYKQRMTKIYTSLPYSLLPVAAQDIIFSDQKILMILCTIWSFVLILPLQISQRLRGIVSISACTKTGRRIFSLQAIACVIGGILSCLFITASYTLILYLKGILYFLSCPVSTSTVPMWFDISALEYYIIQCVIMLFISVSASLLAYIIGRIATSYISGLAIGLPFAAILCSVSAAAVYQMFAVKEFTDSLFIAAFGRPLVGIVFVTIIIITVAELKLRHDRTCDL